MLQRLLGEERLLFRLGGIIVNDLAPGERASWKEYRLDNKGIWDWVAWEALTHESVLRNKDDSVLGVIRYKPFVQQKGEKIDLPAFSKGWVMNIEEQHGEAGEACFLTLTWNPFLNLKGDRVENALGENSSMTIEAMEPRYIGEPLSVRSRSEDFEVSGNHRLSRLLPCAWPPVC